jgi:hypothetical protein
MQALKHGRGTCTEGTLRNLCGGFLAMKTGKKMQRTRTAGAIKAHVCAATTLLLLVPTFVNSWAVLPCPRSTVPGLSPSRALVASRAHRTRANVVCAATGARDKRKNRPATAETEVQRLKETNFVREVQDAGMQCDLLSLATFGKLRGVMAKSAIRSGQCMLSYPRTAIMDLASLTSCPCPQLIAEAYWQKAPWYQQLGLWIVAEKAKGAESPWANYIALLPRTLSTPLHWTPDQLDELQYPAIALAVQEQREHFRSLTESAAQHLSPSAPAGALDELAWAMEMVLSRSLDSAQLPQQDANMFSKLAQMAGLGGATAQASTKAMVPMLDMFNHRSSARPRFGYDARTDTFSVSAECSYTKGEQVFITYGDKDNDDLLTLYGFVEEDNPNDIYQLSDLPQWLLDQCALPRCGDAAARTARLALLRTEGLDGPLTGGFVSRQAGFCPKLMAALRVFVASPDELAALEARGGGLSAAAQSGRVSRENEQAVLNVLKAYCVHLLAAKIVKPAAGADLVQQTILRFRLAKRKVLKELFYQHAFAV